MEKVPKKKRSFGVLLFPSVGGGNRGREAEVDLEGLSVGLKAMGCNWLEPRGGSSWSPCELGEVCSLVAGCCVGVKS